MQLYIYIFLGDRTISPEVLWTTWWTTVDMFIFICGENFMLSWVENEKKFYDNGAWLAASVCDFAWYMAEVADARFSCVKGSFWAFF